MVSSRETVFVQFLITVAVLGAVVPLIGCGYRGPHDPAAMAAIWIGAAVSLLGSLAGAVPLRKAYGRPAPDRLPAIFVAMGVRVGTVLVLAAVVAASGRWPLRPLLVWVAIMHAVLLIPDSLLAVRSMTGRRATNENDR